MIALTLHRGLDYACILRPDDTTDTALVQVRYPTDEDLVLLQQMAAAPQLLEGCQLAIGSLLAPDAHALEAKRRISAAIAKATGAA